MNVIGERLSGHTPISLCIVADVLAWVSRRDGVRPRARPLGDELRLVSVLSPSPELVSQAGALAAEHAARLGLRAPPLGQTTPFGVGVWLLVLALGFVDRPELMLSIVALCAPPSGAWDLILRDALVVRALEAELHEEVLEALRLHSPLSAVFERPAAGGEDAAMVLMDEVALSLDGRRMLVHAFARPTSSPLVWRFRASVMDRLRLRERGPLSLSFVLEVYEAAFVFHGDRIRAQRKGAEEELGRGKPDPKRLEEALAFAAYWGPLSRIRRANPEALRARVYLELEDVLEVCRLHRLSERRLGEAA